MTREEISLEDIIAQFSNHGISFAGLINLELCRLNTVWRNCRDQRCESCGFELLGEEFCDLGVAGYSVFEFEDIVALIVKNEELHGNPLRP